MSIDCAARPMPSLEEQLDTLLVSGLGDRAIAALLDRVPATDILVTLIRTRRAMLAPTHRNVRPPSSVDTDRAARGMLGKPPTDRRLPSPMTRSTSRPDVAGDAPAPVPTGPAPAAGGFTETPQHTPIFAAMTRGSSAVIQAVAGSGKTTTLVEGCRRMQAADGTRRLTFLAYNKSIVATLRSRLPRAVRVSTLHGAAFQGLRQSRDMPDGFIRDGRVMDAAWAVIQESSVIPSERAQAARDLRSLWSLALNTMTSMQDTTALQGLAAGLGLSPDQQLLPMVGAIDRRLRADPSGISYDEMLRTAVEEGLDVGRAHTVVVDESQDLNLIQMALIERMQPSCVMAVGDPHQAIYAFRGADATAMDTLARRFGVAQSLPLSVTYRCATEIVRLAQTLVPSIEARPGAPAGEVQELLPDVLMDTIGTLQPGNLVLCRTNKPLLGALLHRRRFGSDPLRIIGEDLGRTIITLCERHARARSTDRSELIAQSIGDEVIERTQRMQTEGRKAAADAVSDEAQTAILLLHETDVLAEAVHLVQRLFAPAPEPRGINFATIHKAKGLEADRVVILGHNLIPSKRVLASRSPALIQQERNLLYVAYTRARTQLVLQHLPDEGALT